MEPGFRGRRSAVALAALAAGSFMIGAVSTASAVKPTPPSCSVDVTGDGTGSVTFTAEFLGVPKKATTQLIVDGDVVAQPFATTDVGPHEASCQIRRNKRVLYRSADVVGTVSTPAPSYACAMTSKPRDALTVTLNWSVTVTNPDDTAFDVWVWSLALAMYEQVAPDATGSVSGTLVAADLGIATQFNVGAFADGEEPQVNSPYCWRSNLGTGSG